MNEITYTPFCAVVLGVEDDDPILKQMQAFYMYIVETNRILLHVQVMHTVDYNVHFHVDVIELSDVFKTVVLDKLYSPLPLHVRRLPIRHNVCKVIIV